MNKIKEVRRKKGIYQYKVAESLGMNVRTFQRWESEGKAPKGYTLNDVAKVLNCSIEELE